jgi:hypothetical protein
MDEKPLLIDKEGLIRRLKHLENEIEDIKKELGPPSEQKMSEEKPPDCSECCRDCAVCCSALSLCYLVNQR